MQYEDIQCLCILFLGNFQLLNQSTGMWEKLDATCSHNEQGGYYKSSTNVDVKDCLKTCDEDDECMGVSYSANPKKCFFMKKKCDGGVAETIGKPDDMQHYSGTMSDLEKCTWHLSMFLKLSLIFLKS